MARIQTSGPDFPMIPTRWGQEERSFALGLRNIIDAIYARVWQRAWPVGSVILTAGEEKPFTFGKWEAVATGITGVYGWKRTG